MPAGPIADDDGRSPPPGSDGAGDRRAASTPKAGIPRTADLGRGNFAGMEWASADLMKKLAALDQWRLPPPPSPARVFGSMAGAMALADAVGATEPRRIERLEARMVEVEARLTEPPPAPQLTNQEAKDRRTPKRGKATASRKTDKLTKKMVANNLLLKLEKLTLQDIRDEFGQPSDSVIETELAKRVFSKSAAELTPMLHEQFGYPLSGQKTLTRTPKYIDWAPHRALGNSRRLDPESPAVDATAAGGKSSKSGATRNSDFVASNGLSEGKFRKTPTLDAEARRRINDDQRGKAFLRANPELFGEHLEGDE